MPGFAWNFPGPGKLKARAGVAAAESQGKYFTFESAVLQAAFNLKRAYYQLGLLDEQLRLKQRVAFVAGKPGTRRPRAKRGRPRVALPDLLRVQSERDRVRTDLANLEDSRRSLLENFKAALGLTPGQADPPTPTHFEISRRKSRRRRTAPGGVRAQPTTDGDGSRRARRRSRHRRGLQGTRAGFQCGLSARRKASPVLYWPQAGMSLPIWRDKIAAEVAGPGRTNWRRNRG